MSEMKKPELVDAIANRADGVTKKDIEAVLDADIADAVSMCRPFVMDPWIVKKFREGTAASSGCTSCNGCIGMHRTKLHCVLNQD